MHRIAGPAAIVFLISVSACGVEVADEDRDTYEIQPLRIAKDEADARPEKEKEESPYNWRKGWVRTEFSAMTAWKSGSRSRTGDFGARVTIDYEMPVYKHLTVGPRLMPIMYWNENSSGNNDIVALGLGFAIRGYAHGMEHRGIYGEIALHAIGQTAKFSGNSGSFNFMEEFSAGYQFKSDWNVSARVGHISNAGISARNSGVNLAAIGFGYRFKP